MRTKLLLSAAVWLLFLFQGYSQKQTVKGTVNELSSGLTLRAETGSDRPSRRGIFDDASRLHSLVRHPPLPRPPSEEFPFAVGMEFRCCADGARDASLDPVRPKVDG